MWQGHLPVKSVKLFQNNGNIQSVLYFTYVHNNSTYNIVYSLIYIIILLTVLLIPIHYDKKIKSGPKVQFQNLTYQCK